jgi:LPPG:FO 2-phospho-L-lactate transferase
MRGDGKIVVLSGGVGGAKLVHGLAQVIPPERLVVVVNTGDDFKHLGLRICPDLDTVTYTLAGLADPKRGWGRANETWNFMAALKQLGAEDWFKLGDRDLALHVQRMQRLAQGESLTEVTAGICRNLGISSALLPMSNDPVATIVETPDGPLAFQHYFVRDRCLPNVTGFRFDGIDRARANPALLHLFADCVVSAVIIAPSNPYVSVDPILALAELRTALDAFCGPIVAVSPIIGRKAIRGPAAKMMQELGVPPTVIGIAAHYQGTIDGLVIDKTDQAQADEVIRQRIDVRVEQTVMHTLEDRVMLARACLEFADVLIRKGVR